MPATANFAIPYPTLTDPPNGPAQMQSLAEAADAMGVTLSTEANIRAGGVYRGTSISIPTGATKLSFGTAVTAASGITWNGADQFTVTASGVYSFTVTGTMSFVGTSDWAVGIHDGTAWPAATGYTAFGPMLFATGQTNSFSSGTYVFQLGQTISAYAYNNEGTARTLLGAEFRVWRVSP